MNKMIGDSDSSILRSFFKILIIVLVLIVVGLLVWCAIIYLVDSGDEKDIDSEKNNLTDNLLLVNDLNGSDILNESLNQTQDSLNNSEEIDNETFIDDGSIPNPNGDIFFVDIEDEIGEYFCNNITNPEHVLRLYTYRIIEGIKNFSEEYLEADKKDDFCDYYEDISLGINYYLRWEWDAVEGVDGYRLYQYYSFRNITVDYDKYVDIRGGTERLVDTGLDIWFS